MTPALKGQISVGVNKTRLGMRIGAFSEIGCSGRSTTIFRHMFSVLWRTFKGKTTQIQQPMTSTAQLQSPLLVSKASGNNLRAVVAALLTAGGLTLLPISYWLSRVDNAAHALQHDVKHAGDETARQLLTKFQSFELVLRGVRGFVQGSETVTESEFRAFVNSLDIEKTARGLLGVVFAPLVSAQELPSFLAQSGSRFGVANLDIAPPGVRDAYAPILFIEPLRGSNTSARGLDILGVRATRQAALEARDRGQPTLTSSIALAEIRGEGTDSAFVLYVPIYSGPQTSVQPATKNLIGWAGGRFRLKDVVLGQDFQLHAGLQLQLFEGETASAEAFVFGRVRATSAPYDAASANSIYASRGTIDVGGKKWTYHISPTPEFIAANADRTHHWFTALGLVLSALAGAIVWLLLTGRDRANRAAERMTLELRKLTSDMEGTLSAVPDLLFEMDSDGRYLALRTRTEAGLLVPRQELIGKTVHDILPKAAAQTCIQAFEEAKESGFSFGRQIELTIDGSPRWFELSIARKDAEENLAPRFVMLSRDVTDRVSATRNLKESEQALKEAQRIAAIGHFWIDSEEGVWRGSASASEILGLPADQDLPLKQMLGVIESRFRERFLEMSTSLQWDQAKSVEFGIKRGSDGASRWVLMCRQGQATRKDISEPLFFTLQDVTDRHRSGEQLRLLEKAVASLNDMVVVTEAEPVDAPGPRIVFVNDAFVRKTGYERAEVLGKSPRILQGPDTSRLELDRIRSSLTKWDRVRAELLNYTKDETPYWVEMEIQPIADEDGWFTHWVSVERDVTERRTAEEKVHQLAFFDDLTNLPNRAGFIQAAEVLLTGQPTQLSYGAALLIDLDNFKVVNDNWGHQRGDHLLIETARRIQAELGVHDLMARLGGDEFIVLIKGTAGDYQTANDQLRVLSERLLESIARPSRTDSGEHFTTASIGVVQFGDEPTSIEELLNHASSAMHSAKESGGGTFRFYDGRLQAQLAERVLLEFELRQSIKRQELYLLYQPQVNVNGEVVGAEALCRWNHRTRGPVSPAAFIPLAESSGFIQEMGVWILEAACDFLSSWKDVPDLCELTLSVNVSARQFHHPNFLGQVKHTLEKTGADPLRLKLELTESIFAEDIEGIIAKMGALRDLGLRFSLDDFGTGYSSLSYLKKLPLDQLKIDQSFIKDITSDSSDEAIVQTIIALGQSLGLEVIAEGVESPAQREFLKMNGCVLYQGYLFGRPISSSEFIQNIAIRPPMASPNSPSCGHPKFP